MEVLLKANEQRSTEGELESMTYASRRFTLTVYND